MCVCVCVCVCMYVCVFIRNREKSGGEGWGGVREERKREKLEFTEVHTLPLAFT